MSTWGGGGASYEKPRGARRLALGYKLRILVSLRMTRHYFELAKNFEGKKQ